MDDKLVLHLLRLLIAGMLSVFLVACSSTKEDPKPPQQTVKLDEVKECSFPGSDKAAPLWICDIPVEGVELQAVGNFRKSSAGLDFMKQQAAAAARVRIAQQMKVHVSNQIKQFAETTGAGDSETVDQVSSSVTNQLTDQDVVGSKVYRSLVAPDGSVYVLVGIDAESVKKVTKNVISTSMKNDEATWQKIRSDKSQAELAEAIANSKK